uniref:Pulmonary surfactant-associated protein D n=2 Tax=Bactrocera latifrons TaxID=174628 RepID=A0A0K8UVP7_BACLA
MNWFEASYYCRSYGGELANIKSYAELLALQDYILAQEITSRLWIDGNDLAREGEYISHATGRPLTFTNWLPNNPDNSSNEDCLELYLYNKTLLMNDDNCDRKIFAICQYPERYRQKSLTYQNDNSILSGLVEAFAQTFQNCKSRALCPTS